MNNIRRVTYTAAIITAMHTLACGSVIRRQHKVNSSNDSGPEGVAILSYESKADKDKKDKCNQVYKTQTLYGPNHLALDIQREHDPNEKYFKLTLLVAYPDSPQHILPRIFFHDPTKESRSAQTAAQNGETVVDYNPVVIEIARGEQVRVDVIADCVRDVNLQPLNISEGAFLLQAVANAPNDFDLLSRAVNYAQKKGEENSLEVIRTSDRAFPLMDEDKKKDKRFFLSALARNVYIMRPEIQSLAGTDYGKDREIVLAAVKKNGEALTFADQSLQSDKIFLEQSFAANINSANYMKEKYPGLEERRLAINSDMSNLGLSRLSQMDIPLAIAEELIRNRKNNQPDGRPLALVNVVVEDHNDAFRSIKVIDGLVKKYRVVAFEAKTDPAFFQAVRENGEKQKISFQMISGHGAYNMLSFGMSDIVFPLAGSEGYFLDLSDENKMADFKQYYLPGATIILNSCSTGWGENTRNNIANMMKRVLPQANISAPTRPSINNTTTFISDTQGNIARADFFCGLFSCTYSPR